MNKDERANRFIGHVETKEKRGKRGGGGERKCVARRGGKDGTGTVRGDIRKYGQSRWMEKKKLIIERCN